MDINIIPEIEKTEIAKLFLQNTHTETKQIRTNIKIIIGIQSLAKKKATNFNDTESKASDSRNHSIKFMIPPFKNLNYTIFVIEYQFNEAQLDKPNKQIDSNREIYCQVEK